MSILLLLMLLLIGLRKHSALANVFYNIKFSGMSLSFEHELDSFLLDLNIFLTLKM